MDSAVRFRDLITKKAPVLINEMNEGALEDEFIELEKLINNKLPADFIKFYKIYNGGQYLFESEELLSIERIIEEYKVWKDLLDGEDFSDSKSEPTDDSIKDDWWNPLWIPITYDGCGNHYCLDLDPTTKGNIGQIIRFWHDDGERYIKANSFKEFIENYLNQIESGELIYMEDYRGFVEKEYLDR